jgi:DNA-directed RNA polymerase II subunit RPB11
LFSSLQRQPSVLFSGYRVPHPLDYSFQLRIQTNKETTPNDAFATAIYHSIKELTSIQESFIKEFDRFTQEHKTLSSLY